MSEGGHSLFISEAAKPCFATQMSFTDLYMGMCMCDVQNM